MQDIYIVFVAILFILAISDLVVGITNDAANFVNSSVGSKAASLKVILSIAALGVLVGATFSSGMMEIARSGIFYPGQFLFPEIMVIFLAVMITDVILLDTFNTFGFPTSTTVSIVFELLGASVAVSILKISASSGTLFSLGEYINSAKALAIISGILISVVLAFTLGTIIQFITRLIFTFDYRKNLKYFGAVWGGLAISAIVYFMLVKGAKGASFLTSEALEWIEHNTILILGISFAFFTFLLQVLMSLFKINILRIIVLTGTFSLAMAFAGNDLVNFIGVPLAGFESFISAAGDPMFDPATRTMGSLSEPVKTPTLILLAAGMIMVITLFLSKKARTVSQTEIRLARQGEGEERFSSTLISRSLVRLTISLTKSVKSFIPQGILNFIGKRFNPENSDNANRSEEEKSSFDLLRASVNMFVASILIATGTSLKLPLSTTYVTFMVAMGTSLADRAWGRESAVYRITGVVSVIGGWFFTALSAFTVSFIVALILFWGGIPAAVILLAVALLFVVRTNFLHKKKLEDERKKQESDDPDTLNGDNVLSSCNKSISEILNSVSGLYCSSMLNLIREDRKKMKKVVSEVNDVNRRTKELKNNIYNTLQKLEEDSIETGHYYVQILDYLREIAHCLSYISDPVYEHLDNNHPPLLKEQVKDIHELNEHMSSFFFQIQVTIKRLSFLKDLEHHISRQQQILELIVRMKKRQIKLVKSGSMGTRNTLMYLNILSESKNLVLYTINMLKSHRDFLHMNQNSA